MIIFWFFAVAMIAAALIFLLRPFYLDMRKNDIKRSALNVSIAKERLSELDIELEQGIISQCAYEQITEELEQELLYDVDEDNKDIKKVNNRSYNHFTRIVLILSVPILTISLYAYLGKFELIEGGIKQTTAIPVGHASSNGAGNVGSLDEMLEKLAAKLKEDPTNAKGWFMLARSYMTMNRYKEALVALEKTNELIPNNPNVMLQYADALIRLNGGKISGKPFDLIKQAIVLKPDDPAGLWLIGMGYEEQGNYSKAISYWNLLLPVLQAEKSTSEVQKLIRQAKRKAGISTENSIAPGIIAVEKKATTSLKISVSIDKSKLKDVSMTDTVFIFAKATSGPAMPLAVVRKQVKNLPINVVLDDSMAMLPSMKLSNFKKVKIVARISKSESPNAQSGDIQSAPQVVAVDQKQQINLIINKLLP